MKVDFDNMSFIYLVNLKKWEDEIVYGIVEIK